MGQAFPPAGGYAQTPTGAVTNANFGYRLGAVVIDAVLLSIVNSIIGLILGNSASQVLSIIIGIGYFAYMEGELGATFGKRVLGLKVIDANSGQNLGIARGALRYIGRIPSALVCLLGYFWMLWDKQSQTWHDKIATSLVIKT